MNCLLDTSNYVSPCSPGSWNPLGCAAEMSCSQAPPHPWGMFCGPFSCGETKTQPGTLGNTTG